MSDQPLFIHGRVDDFKLRLAPFRVLCHVSRRAGAEGVCWASVENIATVCGIRRNTAFAAIRFLEDHNILEIIRRPGVTNQIRIRPIDAWKPVANQDPSQKETHPKRSTTGSPKGAPGGVQKRHHPPTPKGAPLSYSPEVTPKKLLQVSRKGSAPKNLDSLSHKLSDEEILRAHINQKEGSR